MFNSLGNRRTGKGNRGGEEMRKLQIIYKDNHPYGIRDETGFLIFFTYIQKYQNQEVQYRAEIEEQYKLADYLLEALRSRGKK